MFAKIRSITLSILALTAAAFVASPAYANFSSWRINEVYSNEDGSIQYIEFIETAGMDAQGSFGSKFLWTYVEGAPLGAPLTSYQFPYSLSTATRNKYVLIATAGFQDLLGAVQPDYIMPDGFLVLDQIVRIRLHPIDEISFEIGDIPDAGNVAYYPRQGGAIMATSPTNFAGDVGWIDLPEPSGAMLGWTTLAALAALRRRTRMGWIGEGKVDGGEGGI